MSLQAIHYQAGDHIKIWRPLLIKRLLGYWHHGIVVAVNHHHVPTRLVHFTDASLEKAAIVETEWRDFLLHCKTTDVKIVEHPDAVYGRDEV